MLCTACAVLCNQVADGVYDSELARFQGILQDIRAAGSTRAAEELENNSPLKKVVSCFAWSVCG